MSLYDVNGSSSSGWRSINSGSNVGNLWLIGAKFDNSNDGFKLESLKFTSVPAVPEPSTWLMMILGFGLVGGVMRSKRRENLTVSYS
ncbi:MAG: PEP-CTERM sorting domain-containing protein [Altererythrobacter sp.]|nr:PEP-CTERM sorting domain-containing protein [Altererythrobacter sp.]